MTEAQLIHEGWKLWDALPCWFAPGMWLYDMDTIGPISMTEGR